MSVPSPLCPRSRVHREKVRMRGYKIKQLRNFIPSPRPFYARAAGCSRCTQKPGIKERELTGQQWSSIRMFLSPEKGSIRRRPIGYHAEAVRTCWEAGNEQAYTGRSPEYRAGAAALRLRCGRRRRVEFSAKRVRSSDPGAGTGRQQDKREPRLARRLWRRKTLVKSVALKIERRPVHN